MPKRKADSLGGVTPVKDSKKAKQDAPAKSNGFARGNMLVDSDSDSGSDEEMGGALLEEPAFKINEEYARRFEHNKKREELQQLEEKYEKEKKKPVNGQYGDKYDDDEDSSSGEDEDDEGFLATEALDAEISATLQAIRNKDPRVYDEKVTFYAPIEEGDDEGAAKEKQEKPMYLKDYHRENLLAGHTGAEYEDTTAPRTFVQEQEDLKKNIVREMHAAAGGESSEGDDDDEDGFLKPKTKPERPAAQAVHPSRAKRVKVELNIETADKDPETFLSNFMAARAWVPGDGARFQPLESDDDEEDARADKFESAYNMRFEDPAGSNEMLKSYARDVIAAKSVRREEPKGRKKQRDAEREKKDAEKRERDEDRARLRKLKIEEMEKKLQQVKKAAGIKGKTLKDDEWTEFLDEGWDDDNWEKEMNKRFGEDYYAENEFGDNSDDEEGGNSKKKKVKKPKWDDDIDIKDIIPDFIDDEETEKPAFSLSDSENEVEADEDEDDNEDGATLKKSKTSKDHKKDKADKKKAARLERKKIEELVDNRLDIDNIALPSKSNQPSIFRYRETSPSTFGLTARDILMAPDTALNQWAGLKKMATFRDVEKKRKDKKRLNKKARLREWRKETFGNEDGPEIVIANGSSSAAGEKGNGKKGGDVVEGKRKKKRSGKGKGKAAAVVADAA